MKVKKQERIIFQGQSHIVVKRFTYKGESKIELYNPANYNQFVIKISELKPLEND